MKNKKYNSENSAYCYTHTHTYKESKKEKVIIQVSKRIQNKGKSEEFFKE